MMEIPYSEACERNKTPILDAIGKHLDKADTVLEIGSGTGQHAVYFATEKPHLSWQVSDQKQYIDGICAQLDVAKLSNIQRPIELNVQQKVWLEGAVRFDVLYSANTLHIMREAEIKAFFAGLPQVINQGSKVIVYGPFKYDGKFTSASNAAFDGRLRERAVGSAIRDFEWVNGLAHEQGLALIEDHTMPANNQCLVWHNKEGLFL